MASQVGLISKQVLQIEPQLQYSCLSTSYMKLRGSFYVKLYERDRSILEAKSLHTTNDSVCISVDNRYMGWKIGLQKLPFDALIPSDSFNAHRQ